MQQQFLHHIDRRIHHLNYIMAQGKHITAKLGLQLTIKQLNI